VTFLELLARLERGWNTPLPGAPAQALMAPQRRGDWPAGVDAESARHAAGLLLLFPVDGHAHVILTVRSAHVRHGGQVSLPGGVIELDETVEQAALREAHEEIALATAGVQLHGRLTSLDIPVSGFRLHPVVATLPHTPAVAPSDREVARILEVPVGTLLDPATVRWRPMRRGPVTLEVPGFEVDDTVIWGATAMVLAEFLAVVGWTGPQGRS
jgi:8-oxo-dGTP pyrophosphatase MutT (NUDIX family)